MAVIRLQHKVPEIYVNESRDFQLLCRLYDCIINGVKYDIDSMQEITDSHRCSNQILQLLQTKLGFFTNIDITDQDLRYVLEAFPVIVKGKGSRRAIQQAVNVFLRINHMKTGCYIQIINKTPDLTQEDYVIKIGIESEVRDTAILDQIFKYILPPGYILYYYFYTSISPNQPPFAFSSNKLNWTVKKTIEQGSVGKVDDEWRLSGAGEVQFTDDANIVYGYYKPATDTEPAAFYGNYDGQGHYSNKIDPICESDSLYYVDLTEDEHGVRNYDEYVFLSVNNIRKFYKVTFEEDGE